MTAYLSRLSAVCLLLVLPSAASATDPAQAARNYLETLGVEFTTNPSGEVNSIRVSCTAEVTDSDFGLLRHFPKTEKLIVIGGDTTEAWLVHLKHLPELTELRLYGNEYTDADMVHLKGLKKLRRLTFHSAELTDRGVEHLTALTALEWLELPAPKLTTAGLDHLKKLPNLHTLQLKQSTFTDAGAFVGFPKLKVLKIGTLAVTDDGLKVFQGRLPGVEVTR